MGRTTIESRQALKTERTAHFGYVVAVVGVLLMVLVCALLAGPGVRGLLLAFLLPVMLAAAVGGIGPGIAATALGIVALAAPPLGGFDGSWRAGDLGVFALFAAEGALLSWLISSRPKAVRARGLAERGRVEEALRRSEERYRAIVDTQAEMVCRFRPDGEILFVNGGYARARGTAPEELLGRNFWNFIANEDRAGVRDMLDRLTPESPEVRIENRFETSEGVRWTLWTNRALAFDDAGRWTEAQSTGIDITERKKAEQALVESNRRKSEFLAVLGHELRNPLAPLSAGIELLRHRGETETVDDVRAMMKRQLDHLTRLVEDLLDLSRISRGEIALRGATVDLRDIVRDAVELTRPLIGERDHRLVIDVGPEPLAIDGDFQRLTQVVANLLSNAAKYTEPGGTIEVAADREGEQAVVRVRDTGFGFPPERRDTLFEMFTQVPEHRARTGGGGLGIGLALSRQLVELHGGAIDAASDGPGCGSEFSIRLPLSVREPVRTSAPEHKETSPARISDRAALRRILVVDDNVDAAESLRLVLELDGHTVRVEHDGKAALEAVERFDPEVVLLDIGMPEMDGYEAARHIRSLPNGDRIVLIAITGWGQSADRERALAAGFDEHLPKPVDFAALAALIESDAGPARGGLARRT